MKNKITIFIGAFALLGVAGMGFTSYQKANSKFSSLLMQNVQALAQGEVSDKKDCLPSKDFTANDKVSTAFRICPEGTTSSTIGQCPTSSTYGKRDLFYDTYECYE